MKDNGSIWVGLKQLITNCPANVGYQMEILTCHGRPVILRHFRKSPPIQEKPSTYETLQHREYRLYIVLHKLPLVNY